MTNLKRNVIANFTSGIWMALMGIAFVPFYIRYLGIEAFGLIGFYIALQAITVIFDFGFTPSLTREAAKFKASGAHQKNPYEILLALEVIYLLIATLAILVVSSLSSWITENWLKVDTLSESEVGISLILMCICIFLRWYSNLYKAILIGLQNQVWTAGLNIVFSTLRGPGVILVLLLIQKSITLFFIFQAICFIFECLVARIKVSSSLPKLSPPRLNFKSIKAIGSFTMGVAGINFTAVLLTQLDKFMISFLLPLSTLGYYTLASSISASISLVVLPVLNASFPKLTESIAKQDTNGVYFTYKDMSELLGVVVIPIGICISCYSNEILYLWTNDPSLSSQASPLLSILVLGSMINGLLGLPYILQLSNGTTKIALGSNIISLVWYLPAIYIGIVLVGEIAPAFFWLIVNICIAMIAIPIMHRTIIPAGFRPWLIYSFLLPLTVSSAIAFLMKLGFMSVSFPPYTTLLFITTTLILMIGASFIVTPLGRRLTLQFLYREKGI